MMGTPADRGIQHRAEVGEELKPGGNAEKAIIWVKWAQALLRSLGRAVPETPWPASFKPLMLSPIRYYSLRNLIRMG
jgi:hypothetical protein